jgi:hypothetical protein
MTKSEMWARHTCTCGEDYRPDGRKQLIYADLKPFNAPAPKGRMIYVLTDCSRCGNKILFGSSGCHYASIGSDMYNELIHSAYQLGVDTYDAIESMEVIYNSMFKTPLNVQPYKRDHHQTNGILKQEFRVSKL